jgi:hypothetical protein
MTRKYISSTAMRMTMTPATTMTIIIQRESPPMDGGDLISEFEDGVFFKGVGALPLGDEVDDTVVGEDVEEDEGWVKVGVVEVEEGIWEEVGVEGVVVVAVGVLEVGV